MDFYSALQSHYRTFLMPSIQADRHLRKLTLDAIERLVRASGAEHIEITASVFGAPKEKFWRK